MVSIKYENIGVAYGDFIVVQNFNLDIPHGTITTLLGPSGCGKTTVLRALAGFVEPFEGNVFIGDNNVTLLPPQKRNTAMIFQNYALWPHLTIFKNVEYGLKLRESDELAALKSPWYSRFLWVIKPYYFFLGKTHSKALEYLKEAKEEYCSEKKGILQISMWYLFIGFRWLKTISKGIDHYHREKKEQIDPKWAYRREKVFEALRLVHLEDQAFKNPTQLSGGQQQRIALSRSLVVEPDVLLCDEPLSNLDAKLRKELRTEIRSIIKSLGMTTVYVTHDQTEALAISDRIAVFNIGNIEQYGTPTEVFTDPHTLFVGQFIGISSTLVGKIIKPNVVELKGGETVKLQVKTDIPVGEEVFLVIRPENVSLTSESDSPIEIEINTIEYLGTEVKMTGKLKDDTILLLDVAERAHEYAQMKVGTKLTAYINTAEMFVFVGEDRVY